MTDGSATTAGSPARSAAPTRANGGTQPCLLAGAIALAAAWVGPVPLLAEEAFSGHMTMHMLNVGVGAPLVAIGLAGGPLDPVIRWRWLFAVIPASIAELIVVWGWHAPRPHHFARHTSLGIFAEQASFFLVALWVWLSAFGGRQPRERSRSAAGVIGLLLTSMHMTFLGALLGLAPRQVYPHHTGFGSLTALQDQHLGGAVMLVIGGLAYLSGGLWLARDLVNPAETVPPTYGLKGESPQRSQRDKDPACSD